MARDRFGLDPNIHMLLLYAGTEIRNLSYNPVRQLIWLVILFALLGPGTK